MTASQRPALPHRMLLLLALGLAIAAVPAQAAEKPSAAASPIAIVPIDADGSVKVSGALVVTRGRALISTSGSITSGEKTTVVSLPRRGLLRVCASTTVKLASDPGVPAGETPGLMMALDRGALEMSYGAARNADVLLTPDFRILIAGPGAIDVKVRLGEHGDTCIDNAGDQAPYVLVTSVFENGAYRVQAGQRVMFQHGSLNEAVDHEKESCGCPPPVDKAKNEFPVAQSAGLTPLEPVPAATEKSGTPAPAAEPLVFIAPTPAPAPVAPEQPVSAPAPEKKHSAFVRFFRRIFGRK